MNDGLCHHVFGNIGERYYEIGNNIMKLGGSLGNVPQKLKKKSFL
jgi:hypothetical protein